MSISIVLQRNESERNRVTKTLTAIATVTGVLKDTTSIIDPSFIITGDIADYVTCNYCTIAVFGRSYYVKDMRSLRNNVFEISCHVDALSSFSAQIKACTGIVQRQETNWNLYLNDGVFKVYQDPIIQVKEFPTDFDPPQYVLAVVGG